MFELARNTSRTHLIPQPSDLALNPPESYLLVQDFIIITCGLCYVLCYFFYMIRTYVDRYCAGTPLYLCTTMAYELYYAIVMTSSGSSRMERLERCSFLAWFVMDVVYFGVAMCSAYPRKEWARMVGCLVVGVVVGIGVLRAAGWVWPDDKEMVTAYWIGIALQLPISWGELILLVKRRDTKGQSLEIWITRYIGCYTAYAVFFWRYLNAPQNWAYVNSFWSWFIILGTLFPETIYPFVYIWAHIQSTRKESVEANGKVKSS